MMNAMLKLVSVWMISAGSPAVMNDFNEIVPETSGYFVIEQMDETSVRVETDRGLVELPRDFFPSDEIHEGTVIEWRIDYDEEALRIAEAKARIDRMRYQEIVGL